MSVYDMIKDSLPHTVPFARHTGIELVDVAAGSASARMSQSPENSNHMGTVHSGALFTLAETAAGAAIAGEFAPYLMRGLKAFPEEIKIEYAQSARDVVVAQAQVLNVPEHTQDLLEHRQTAEVSVEILLKRNRSRALIATAKSRWIVRAERPLNPN